MNDQKTCKYSTTHVADRECSDCRAGLCSAGSCGYEDEDNKYYCNKCWTEHQGEDLGLCSSCGTELEPIMENNGFTAPDPTYYEITGYKPCRECEGGNHE